MGTRLTAQGIKSLAGQVPGQQETVAAQQRAAQAIQLRQALGAPGKPSAPAAVAAQQAAPVVQQQAQQQALQLQQQTQQQRQQLGAMALQQEATELERALTEKQQRIENDITRRRREQFERAAAEQRATRRKITDADIQRQRELAKRGIELDNRLTFLTNKQNEDLSAAARNLKQEILDARREFKRDALGQRFANELQLADYAVTSARNRQELLDRLQTMDQLHRNKLTMLQSLAKDMEQTLRQGYLKKKGDLDRKTAEEIAQYQAAIQRQIEREKARGRRMKALLGGVMAVGGAVLMATGAGAPIGASMMTAGASMALS